MSWTNERVEKLKKHWADGLSAAQIAGELGGGITRNAVVGKVHRLNLSGRKKPSNASLPRTHRPRVASMPARVTRPTNSRPYGHLSLPASGSAPKASSMPHVRPVLAPVEEIVVPISLRTTILGLTDQTCKWPIGDPSHEDFHYCGHTPRKTSPYCEYHSRVAYQPVGDRRRRQG